MKNFKIYKFKEFSIFFWLFLISIILIIISTVHLNNKNYQTEQIKNSLKNIYLKKTIEEITNNFKPRYTNFNYTSKSGDTYQTIINNLEIAKNEKKNLLDAISKEKSLKILKVNQKFFFKFDHLSDNQII